MLRGHGSEASRAFVVSAHYDHLGVGVPNAEGDWIYNGFSDNAGGVAMALGIGEALAREGRLRHSLIRFFSAGEEQGLLGSDYFVTHPLWPLNRIEGVVNLDANAPRLGVLPVRPAWRAGGVLRSRRRGPYEGLSVTASDSLRSALRGRYHMPDDNWDERFPFEGLGRYADFATKVIRRMDADYRSPSSGTSRTGPGGSR